MSQGATALPGRDAGPRRAPTGTQFPCQGVERTTYFVRGLACSLVVLGQAMFWCVGTFQDSRPIPRSLVRRTGPRPGGYGFRPGGLGGAEPDCP